MMNTAAPELKECFKCKTLEQTSNMNCPRCGRKLQGPKQIRTRGAVQLASGLFLVIFMGVIAVAVGGITERAMRDPGQAQKITEQASTFLAIYAIFALVIVFGLHGIVIGTFQLVTGRRNKVLVWIMWLLLFLLLFACGLFVGVAK